MSHLCCAFQSQFPNNDRKMSNNLKYIRMNALQSNEMELNRVVWNFSRKKPNTRERKMWLLNFLMCQQILSDNCHLNS